MILLVNHQIYKIISLIQKKGGESSFIGIGSFTPSFRNKYYFVVWKEKFYINQIEYYCNDTFNNIH